MPLRYDQYQLSNSRMVRPFAGSVLPELTTVAGELQNRFNVALESEDMLNRMVKNSAAAPFENDQLILSQLKAGQRDKIGKRVKKGDYENMVRDVQLDARDFVDSYKPIAENATRLQQYQAQLQDNIQKGKIKDPAKAQKLLQASREGYKGLVYDPDTGTYTNQFRGVDAVADIDLPKKIDQWLEKVAPTVLGSEVKYTDGVWKRYKEGKWTTLTSQELGSVMVAAREMDPEFKGWVDQEKLLAGVGLSATDLESLPPNIRARVQKEQQATGKPVNQILKDIAGSEKERMIFSDMQRYANKYVRDDKTTGSGILGADEYALERFKKKQEDEALVLSMPILQPENRVEIKGADDLTSKLSEAGQAAQLSRIKFDEWVATSKIRPNGKGTYIDAAGNDKTMKYLEQKQVMDQASHVWENLIRVDAEAKKRTGYGRGTVTPELMKKAEFAGEVAVRGLSSPGGPGGVPPTVSKERQDQVYQQAKAEYLRTSSPGFAQYDQMVKDMTAAGAQSVNIQTFPSKTVNTQATDLFKNLVLNLDSGGLKAGTQGLKWASGDAAGSDLEADDYKKVRDEAVFAGYGMDTDGQLKYYYKVGKVDRNAKGKSVGEEGLVKMPALPGTIDILVKSKQMHPAQLILGQQIQNTINQPSGNGYIEIDKDNKVFIDRIDKSEIGNSEVAAGINLRFPLEKGGYKEVRVESLGDAISTIIGSMQLRQQREQQKKK